MVEPSATIIDIAYARARQRWVDVPLGLEAFRAQVERLGLDDIRIEARADDLYLVAAAIARAPRAIAELDEVLTRAVSVAARIDPATAFIEDVEQEVRIKLLTGQAPRLLAYSGSGALVDWLRVVALRVALNLKRSDHLHPTAELPEAVLGSDQSALKRWYLDDFHAALEAGFRRLSVRERTLLRLHFLDHLNIERMGGIYGVNRATVARWLVAVRRRLFEEVKAELGAKHGLDTADVKSLYRLMQRDVHVTVSRILQD